MIYDENGNILNEGLLTFLFKKKNKPVVNKNNNSTVVDDKYKAFDLYLQSITVEEFKKLDQWVEKTYKTAYKYAQTMVKEADKLMGTFPDSVTEVTTDENCYSFYANEWKYNDDWGSDYWNVKDDLSPDKTVGYEIIRMCVPYDEAEWGSDRMEKFFKLEEKAVKFLNDKMKNDPFVEFNSDWCKTDGSIGIGFDIDGKLQDIRK